MDSYETRFPLASRYHPDWVRASASGGANALWLTEWLAEAVELRPGMRVLDLGCGRAMSSVFLHREFGARVWAVDLWFSPAENLERIRAAGADEGVFPVHADARSLPFGAGFFDAIVSVDAFVYFGTDDLYLANVARLLKPGGTLAIAGAGLTREIDGPVPGHLEAWWEPGNWCLHSADWWRRHWERTGIVDVELADTMPDGWRVWLEWQQEVAPGNAVEIAALEADSGSFLGYVRAVASRTEMELEEPIVSIPPHYEPHPLLRDPVS
ncbi:MAG TPA: class I SAM-dependent methyltransferase [Thermoleophilaceae bacterium]|jgi:SAM-dependent methyltransferase|nr:class I SAM-dependent methyltransferase [Thermoleophilaceae bacterium]